VDRASLKPWAAAVAVFAAWTACAGDAFTPKHLECQWIGPWLTPATKFCFNLTFTIDAQGRIRGSWEQGGKTTPGLGGQLILKGPAGQLAGKLTFGRDVEFIAQDDVHLEVVGTGAQRHLHIKGTFISKAFPGELGKDILDVCNSPGAHPPGRR
jgi:hypothetical protein